MRSAPFTTRTTAPPPEWIQRALDDGRALHWFAPDENEVWDQAGDFVQSLHNVVDWMRALPEDDRRWRQFHKISVPEAIEAARAWHRSLAKRAAEDWPEDWSGLNTVHRFDNGVKFVELTSAGSLTREGRIMGHCVASYDTAVASGASTIYSLRDTSNRPHITIEIVRAHLHQLKARGNSFPAERWRPYIAAFVRRMGWSFGADGTRLGLFTFCDRTYTDVLQIVDDVPELPALPFDWRVLSPILNFVRNTQPKGAALAPAHQGALIALLRASILAGGPGYRIASTKQLAIELPLGSIAEVRLEIAGAIFALAEMGLLSDANREVTKHCRHIGRQVLALIAKHPGELYRLHLVAGGIVRPGALQRFFAAAGLVLEFDQVRHTTLEHKRKRATDAAVALRHLLADRRRFEAIPPEARAKAWNIIRVQVPRFCEHTLLEPDIA